MTALYVRTASVRELEHSTLHRHLDLSISLFIHKIMHQEADKQQRKHGCVQVGLGQKAKVDGYAPQCAFRLCKREGA